MKLLNQTKHTTLTNTLIIPKSFVSQLLGLLQYKTPQALLLRTHSGIHTFGMNYPIDVLVLDKTHTIMSLKHSLQPNRIFLWNPKYNTIIELPENTIKKTHTSVGDRLRFENPS